MLYIPLHHTTLLLQMGICYMASGFTMTGLTPASVWRLSWAHRRTRKIALLQWKIQKRLFRAFVLSWLKGENETDINIQKPKIIKSLIV